MKVKIISQCIVSGVRVNKGEVIETTDSVCEKLIENGCGKKANVKEKVVDKAKKIIANTAVGKTPVNREIKTGGRKRKVSANK